MATVDEYLQSVIQTAENIRNELTTRTLLAHEDALLKAAKKADDAVEEMFLILESPLM